MRLGHLKIGKHRAPWIAAVAAALAGVGAYEAYKHLVSAKVVAPAKGGAVSMTNPNVASPAQAQAAQAARIKAALAAATQAQRVHTTMMARPQG